MSLFKTVLAGSLLSASVCAQATPIFSIFELGVQPAQTARYTEIGTHNVHTSIATEAGTLAMFALADNASPQLNYMAEIYADDIAYKTHLQSPQYQQFAQNAPQILTAHKKKIELLAQFLGDKKVEQTPQTQVHLVVVDVQASANTDFAQIVTAEMAQALAIENGVLAMYAATAKDQPNRWYFLEVYADEQAYQQHRQTPHFQSYLAQTAAMVKDKRFINVSPVVLGNQGGLRFRRPGL